MAPYYLHRHPEHKRSWTKNRQSDAEPEQISELCNKPMTH